MTAAVALVGISGTRTRAHERERLHVTPERAAALSRSLARSGREAVMLTTCNRTEIYVAASDICQALEQARQALTDLGGGNVPQSRIYASGGQAAAAHLFRVAAGLESIVLGDTHVARQVRCAHDTARGAGATGPVLNRLFQDAAAASKRVRSQTSLSKGTTSIPAAAIATAARIAPPLADRRVLIIGAGRIAKVAALNAASRGCGDIVIASRTLARSHDVAAAVSGRAVPLDELESELEAADVVISATTAPGFILTAEHAAAARNRSDRRPLAIFDLALPRDVNPLFGDLYRTQLVDLDDLARIVAGGVAVRRAGLQHADMIIRQEAARYESWRRRRRAWQQAA